MKKILIGLAGGVAGAIINVAFLLFAPNLEMEVYLSTAITWLAIGILISMCDLKMNGIVKGIAVAILVSSSSLVYTMSSSFSSAMWTIVNTVMVGAFIGYSIEKLLIIVVNKK